MMMWKTSLGIYLDILRNIICTHEGFRVAYTSVSADIPKKQKNNKSPATNKFQFPSFHLAIIPIRSSIEFGFRPRI